MAETVDVVSAVIIDRIAFSVDYDNESIK